MCQTKTPNLLPRKERHGQAWPDLDGRGRCWSTPRWESVDECARAAQPVYKLLGGEGNLIVRHPDCGHDFPPELREEAYRLIDSVLRREPQ